MVKELDNTVQLENLAQTKALLNRLLQSLDEQHTASEQSIARLQKVAARDGNVSITADDGSDKTDTDSIDLKRQRDLLMQRLQREEFLSKQYESIIGRHQSLLQTIQENLGDRIAGEQEIGREYELETEETEAAYDENQEVLRNAKSGFQNRYEETSGQIWKAAKALNEEM